MPDRPVRKGPVKVLREVRKMVGKAVYLQHPTGGVL